MNMRQSVGVLAAVVVLLTCPGCDSGVDDRSAALEARISELESTVRNLKRTVDGLESRIDDDPPVQVRPLGSVTLPP